MRVVLIHGSGGNAETAWAAVRPLAERFTLVAPNRGGYPPNSPLERVDFAVQAAELAPLLEDGAHLVGHSYGGVIALLIAAQTDMRWTTSPRLSLELALIRATIPETDAAPEALVSRLERLERVAGRSPGATLAELCG